MFDLGSKNQDLPPWTPNAGGLQGAEPRLRRPPHHPETLHPAPRTPTSLSPGSRGKEGSWYPPATNTWMPACLPCHKTRGNPQCFPQRCSKPTPCQPIQPHR